MRRRGIRRGRRGDEGETETESETGSPEKLDLSSRTPSRSPISNQISRRELIIYLSVRKRLRKKTKVFIEKEMKQSGLEIESVGDLIEEAAKNISATFLRDIAPSLPEPEDIQDKIGFDWEIFPFCEQICVQMKKLLNFFPTTTDAQELKEAQWQQILVLQSISDTISEFCAARGKELEESQTTKELDAELEKARVAMELEEAQATKELDTGLEIDEKEQEGNLIEAGVGGDQIPTETEETLWVEIFHEGKSVTEIEEEEFAAFRRCWEREWGKGNNNSFEDLSLLSPMIFTHGCNSMGAVVGRTFQVYSVKIAEIKGIRWPLKVYGVVAARDDVDKHRNPLFLRSRDNYQIVRQKDPFLQLTGPCRAIVSEEPIEIEIQLRVNRGNISHDRSLISDVFYYNGDNAHLLGSSDEIENHLCKIEISYEQLEQSVQATFFDFHIGEPSPFEFGVRIVCSSLPQDNIEDFTEGQVVLVDSRYGKMSMGNLMPSRQVVSVELQGKLRVLIQAYTPSGGISAHGSIFITPKKCHTSRHTCDIGGCEVKFTVAWSLLLADKTVMLMNGCVNLFEDLPSFDPSLLEKLEISE